MTLKKIVSLVVFVLLVLFIVQNIAVVNLTFMFWEFTLPRSLMVLIVFVLGLASGYILAELRHHHNQPS